MLYKGQSRASIELETHLPKSEMDLATSFKIRFRRPDRVEGFWDAVRVGETSRIVHNLTALEALPLEGNWTIWAELEYADGRLGIGDPYRFLVEVAGGKR